MLRLKSSALTAALLMAMTSSATMAQTLDGAAPASGKVMSINELRECLKRQDALKVRGAAVEGQKPALEQERAAIEAENAAIVADKASITARNDAILAQNEKMKGYSERVAAWNERMKALSETSRSGPSVDRERRELNNEKRELEKMEAQSKSQGTGLSDGLEASVNQLNARAQALQQRTVAWNERNAKFTDDVQAYEDNRSDWRAECGNRRYREDDEKALRSGK